MRKFTIEGSENDTEIVRQELLAELPADGVKVGAIGRQPTDFFDNGEFSDSALVEFAVSVGENLTADTLIAITALVYKRARARANVKVREEKESTSDNGSE